MYTRNICKKNVKKTLFQVGLVKRRNVKKKSFRVYYGNERILGLIGPLLFAYLSLSAQL